MFGSNLGLVSYYYGACFFTFKHDICSDPIILIDYAGGYAEILCVQQNRKAEGERMKSWAESAWRNRRLSLAEALDISEPSSMVPVIDARISRVL